MLVNNEPAKQRILTALSDEYSRQILSATMNTPSSALELSNRYGIPITTVYRRIMELVDAGLIAAVKAGRTPDGKWYDLYRSLLLTISVSYDGTNVKIDATVNDHISEKFKRMWTSIPNI